MTPANIALFTTALLGFIALALAMPAHCRHVFRRTLPEPLRRLLRIAGWILLAIALALAVWQWRFDVGIVTWLGWLSVAGVALVFYLPNWPWQPIAQQRPARQRKKGKAAQDDDEDDEGTNGEFAPTFDTVPRHPARRAALLPALLVIPLGAVAVQLWNAPQKPLLRDDALRGDIGPWSFVLAEKDRKSPTIEALNTPMKAFSIRFCESCNAEIRMAYMKLRKPHSQRTAGNGFFGRGQEKTVEVPVPAAATLKDGLWLTVEGIDGEVHQQHFAIEQLSPALAEFIRKRS